MPNRAEWPPVVYRYFDESRFADGLVAGRLRLTTFEVCRGYESAEQGDREEGMGFYETGTIRGGSQDPDFVEVARRAGIGISPGCSNGHIEDCTSTTKLEDAYLYCVSCVRDDDYFASRFGPYCVEIVSPFLFGMHVTAMATGVGLVGNAGAGPVTYRSRTYTAMEDPFEPAFVKPESYVPQREFRFAWLPTALASRPLKPADLTVPQIAPLCRRVA